MRIHQHSPRVFQLLLLALGLGSFPDFARAAEGSRDLLVSAELRAAGPAEPNAPASESLVLKNRSDKAQSAAVEFSIQQNPSLFAGEPPDPVHGRDRAIGAKSWTEVEGKVIEEGSLTDNNDWTSASTVWNTNHFTEVFQFVDLGRERRITRLAYTAGDANWIWKADVSSSLNGKTFDPMPSLQGLDLHQKWGRQILPDVAPFDARFLRLRYHRDGQKCDVLRMPATLSVYAGAADETWDIPATGKLLRKGTRTLEVPAHGELTEELGDGKPLPTGAYFIAAKVRAGDLTELAYDRRFVMPEPMKTISPASHFGLNASEASFAPLHRRLGIGWVRFENMKWPMISPEPGVYRFDGSVLPWQVQFDSILDAYTSEGISVLPFLFETAGYASSAKADVPQERKWFYPPKDPRQFGEFCFQTVARYGKTAHPAEELKTSDKKSGSGKMSVYEIWNEPNLTDPGWGPWVATSHQYMELLRAGSEAVRRADPQAKVANGGYAGIEVTTTDALRAYTYADGKHPLDFIDVLSVHYYSGQQPPELATVDTNVQRGDDARARATYEDDLRALVAWRNKYKPGMPIWLTETGYDTGGPRGMSEQVQAARLPRVVMIALAEGMEKVFVYREKGSTPSLHAASGLVRDDGSLKPSWFTFATLIRMLDGVTDGKRLPHPDPNVRIYRWTRGKEIVLSAWAINGTAKLGIKLGKCTVTDSFGATEQREADADAPLSIFPIYITGLRELPEAAVRQAH